MDVIGGGVLVAAAAALWIAYLLPTWLRRRQYLATERNAVRLQQTLRILAETAETPEAVRIEATAREVVTQQRILHEHEQAARLAAEAAENLAIAERRAAEGVADAARELAASVPGTEPIPVEPPIAAAPAAQSARARRVLRRRRALCSLILLVSLLMVIVGMIASAFGGSPLVAVGGGLGMLAALAGLVRLSKVRVVAAAAAPVAAVDAEPFEPIELAETTTDDEPGWTPRPLPRPLHLSRGTIAATAMASIEAAAELRRAAADAEVARRVEELEPAMPTISGPAAQPDASPGAKPAQPERRTAEPASPYARMGIVDDARPAFGDLDAVLRRRRQAG